MYVLKVYGPWRGPFFLLPLEKDSPGEVEIYEADEVARALNEAWFNNDTTKGMVEVERQESDG